MHRDEKGARGRFRAVDKPGSQVQPPLARAAAVGSAKLNPTMPSATTTSRPQDRRENSEMRLPMMPRQTSSDSGSSRGSSTYRAARGDSKLGSWKRQSSPQSPAGLVRSSLVLSQAQRESARRGRNSALDDDVKPVEGAHFRRRRRRRGQARVGRLGAPRAARRVEDQVAAHRAGRARAVGRGGNEGSQRASARPTRRVGAAHGPGTKAVAMGVGAVAGIRRRTTRALRAYVGATVCQQHGSSRHGAERLHRHQGGKLPRGVEARSKLDQSDGRMG